MSKFQNVKATVAKLFKKAVEISKLVAFNFCKGISSFLFLIQKLVLIGIEKSVALIKEILSDSKKKTIAKKAVCLAVAVLTICSSFFVVASFFEKCFEVKSLNGGIFVGNDVTAASFNDIVATKLLSSDEKMTVEFESAIAPKSKVLSLEDAAEQLCSENETLEYACGIYVDGVLTAVASNENGFKANLNELLMASASNGATPIGINEKIEYCYGYAKAGDVLSESSVNELFDEEKIKLSVLSVATETYDKEIDFETKVTYDSKKIEGYKSTVKKGVKGVESVTTSVTYLNGKAISTETIASNVVSAPVAAEVVKGTAKAVIENVPAKFSDSKYSSSAEFIWPVEKTPTMYISSYWGDNRGHKGVDITGPKGTPIYAAKGGTVIYSGTHKSYGKYIKIDHGNGIVTLYSHCNSLGVKKGDKVVAGQQIATVGRTGNATGNHLHFEVIKNGTRVNPASYLGIKK